jgi:uncharacterized surface anchored protein
MAIALMAAVPPLTASPAATAMLTVTKHDANSNAPLKGATFAVCVKTDPNCATPVMLTTDAAGTAQTTLTTGSSYCLTETAVPNGYLKMPTYVPASGCVTLGQDGALVAVTDPPAPSPTPSATPTPTPTPSATPSPTPSPTPAPTGELEITKTDQGNRPITVPGFTFNIHVGSAGGQVIATIATDSTGTAIAGALNPAMYCVEETSAPDGYQVAPTYSPSNCVMVASDSTQGRAPTLVTVIDPPASSPTPTAAAAPVPPSASPTPSATAQTTTSPQPPASPTAAVARGLVGIGALLLLAGAVMIVVAIRRRRQPPPTGPPPTDYWYDSTIR